MFYVATRVEKRTKHEKAKARQKDHTSRSRFEQILQVTFKAVVL